MKIICWIHPETGYPMSRQPMPVISFDDNGNEVITSNLDQLISEFPPEINYTLIDDPGDGSAVQAWRDQNMPSPSHFAQIKAVQDKYKPTLDNLLVSNLTAVLLGNANEATEIQAEYKETLAKMTAEIQAIE